MEAAAGLGAAGSLAGLNNTAATAGAAHLGGMAKAAMLEAAGGPVWALPAAWAEAAVAVVVLGPGRSITMTRAGRTTTMLPRA
jgi:hypothetical protein